MQMQGTEEFACWKEQGKMLNKVLAFCIAAAEKRGRSALAHRMPFDEEATLQEFRTYLAAELQLKDGVEIVVDSEEEVAANSEPGVPVLVELVWRLESVSGEQGDGVWVWGGSLQ